MLSESHIGQGGGLGAVGITASITRMQVRCWNVSNGGGVNSRLWAIVRMQHLAEKLSLAETECYLNGCFGVGLRSSVIGH